MLACGNPEFTRNGTDAASPLTPRLRLAIVSTYDELCGIAGYTRALESQIRHLVDVTVFDLDQYLLRSTHRRVQRLADKHIEEIASKLGSFDSVNIQLEHGTLGRTPWQILRRFKRLAQAASCLSVTFHTILTDEPIPWEATWRMIKRGDVGNAGRLVGDNHRAGVLSTGTYGFLRRLQTRSPVRVIVHTKRDMRLVRDVYRINDVFHHPLTFVDKASARAIRASSARADFPMLKDLRADAKLIGTFGFLSAYKGFETAVKALRYLPDHYHLLIFGGIHPQTIKREQVLDPYIGRLLGSAHIGQTVIDQVRNSGIAISLSTDANALELLSQHPQDLHSRIHFMGVLNDEGFMKAMSVCDTVVLPYLEVGQSSSGPISMALDMGCRILASRTAAFLQFARYHPDLVEFFDIGNFAELAKRLTADSPVDCSARKPSFDTATNAAMYVRANTPPRLVRPPANIVAVPNRVAA